MSAPLVPMEQLDHTKFYDRQLHFVPAATERNPSSIVGQEARLKIAVHEYKIKGALDDSFTWVMTHGTSFNKDFWKLIIDNLLENPSVRTRTARILALDAANHGDSAVANKGKLTKESMSCSNAYRASSS